MKKLRLALILAILGLAPAQAQVGPPITAGGMTVSACSTLVVTASSAYTAGNEVGGLISLKPFRSSAQGAPDQGGVLQSIRLNFKDTQTAGFKAYEFSSNPSNSTWTDKSAPAIATADAFAVKGPISLTSNDSGLGSNNTVYNADAIARAHVSATQTDYWVIVTTGTPTFGSTSDVQFCATYLVD